MGEMSSNSIVWHREISHKRKSQLMVRTTLFLTLKKIATPAPNFSNLLSQQPSTWRQDPPPAKSVQLTTTSDDSILSNKNIFKLKYTIFSIKCYETHSSLGHRVNITFIWTGKQDKNCMTHFTEIFALFCSSGIKPTVSVECL